MPSQLNTPLSPSMQLNNCVVRRRNALIAVVVEQLASVTSVGLNPDSAGIFEELASVVL